MSECPRTSIQSSLRKHAFLWAIAGILALGSPAAAQLDVCGCQGHPQSLGRFDMADPTTHPPGTTSVNRLVTIPLPQSGVLIFDSFRAVRPDTAAWTIRFGRNAANTPVTILVAGEVTIGVSVTMLVQGDTGVSASTDVLGRGGLGGPGGFRGGDGAYRLVNFAISGGAGLAPGGGIGATTTDNANGRGGDGLFNGVADLVPLIGGSGGGGGASTTTGTGCAGGGGGGGGGAILIAANGPLTIDGVIDADGGDRGFSGNGSCASSGGGGSGGAIRLLANTITTSTAGQRMFARGGVNRFGARAGAGAIRMEALTITLGPSQTDPVATRAPGPGPLTNPITPTVAITAVGGQPVPVPPQGGYGAVDVTLPASGPAAIDIATSGVPTNTIVEVKVKPRVGGAPVAANVTLTNCDTTGACIASVVFDLAAASYFFEARATFQTQVP
jgi:hypothetical protein